MKGRWIFRTVMIIMATVLLFSVIVMFLWNWLVPDIFHGPKLNLWQSVGLLVLCKILFGGFGPGNWGGGSNARKKIWKDKFNEKWSCLTSEEKKHAQNSFSQIRQSTSRNLSEKLISDWQIYKKYNPNLYSFKQIN